MKNILIVFGTRPEAIKMCPLVKELKKDKSIQTVVCVTGQHREMLDQVLHIFHIEPDYDMNIMIQNQTLSNITMRIFENIQKIIEEEKPDIVLVHGDTTTAFAVSLVCFYTGIRVGHVEAGLRTYNLASPYPEEFNRQVIDLVSDIYFAPTEHARENLVKEGKPAEKIYVTGNTVIDALKTTVRSDYENEHLKWAQDSRLILLTAHRRENLGDLMKNMFGALKRVVQEFPDIKVIYPVHKNPLVREIADEVFAGTDRIKMIEPLNMVDFHNFMARSYLVLTDSGGIQEEAPSLGKPVLVMRNTTERPEGIEAGTIKLVGTQEDRIYPEIKKLLSDEKAYEEMSRAVNPYGDGKASERIVRILSGEEKV